MSEGPNADVTDLKAIIANQRTLGRRLLWLLILPFALTTIVVVMFYTLSSRLTDVEVLTKQITIERYLALDNNLPWAVDQYEQLTKLRKSAAILARLGYLYFAADRNHEKKAIETLDAARALDPQYWETYRSLTFIYAATNQTRNAIEAAEKALQFNDADANTMNNMAWAYATTKEPELHDLQKAREYAEKAVALTKGKKPTFLDTLAEVYFQAGEQARAKELLKRAIAIAPNGEMEFRKHFNALFPTEKMVVTGG